MSKIAKVLRLLGDETRLRILIVVSQTPLNVSELTKILGMAQSGVSRHLSNLRKMKLLRESKEGIWTYYYLAEKEFLEKDLHLLWDYLLKQLSSLKDPTNDRVALIFKFLKILSNEKIPFSTLILPTYKSFTLSKFGFLCNLNQLLPNWDGETTFPAFPFKI